ncbi:MAG: dihydroneopterin aldolase [Pseudomonadota bacterium]
MAQPISLAFDHPEHRASAMAPDGVRDRISLRDHVVEVEIGAFQPERGRTQRVSFNVVVEVRPQGEIADDVDRILSYDRITEAIAAELAVERLNLLETLAERVADRVLAEPQALRCFVRIEKLDLGPGALGVEIVRDAVPEGHDLAVAEEFTPAPVLVFLSNDALASPRLSGWIDGIAAAGLPAIFCVGLPAGERVQTGHAPTQRRVDLLAIEQNAWALAARDPRCVVVDSRTELDWARGKRRISVWAPSKMILDATDKPEGLDARDLALWLADHMEASQVVMVGTDAPGALPLDTKALV